MKSSTRRALAAIIAASCLTIPATASAMPYSPPTTSRSDAAQSGDDGKTNSSIQPQTGSKPESTFPAADFRGGDSPIDHPGASRAQPAPTTVEVIQPLRTIVRNVDQALPIALSSAALLLVLALLGVTLAGTRLVPRAGRSS